MVSKVKLELKQRKKKDKEWSIEVKNNFNNKCAFCPILKMINAHHIIPREIKEFRHDVLNGIGLCPKHHKWGVNSAHRNPLWFFIKLEELYPLKIDKLVSKYRSILNENK